jgi:hypothetical protein
MIKTETAAGCIESKGGLVPAGKLVVKAGPHNILSVAVKNAAAEADAIIGQLRERGDSLIRKAPIPKSMHGLWIEGRNYIPVDIDTTAMDNSKTKKEGASRTYRGYDGYHPIFAYLGKEGYMPGCELRPGSRHCQNGMAEFIKGLVKRLDDMKAGSGICSGWTAGTTRGIS